LIAGGDAQFDVYEGTTFSAAGTSITPVNHNRTSVNTCGCTVTHTPTVTVLGTHLWRELVPGGSQGQTPGAVQDVATAQVILADNETYLMRMTNLSQNAEINQIMVAYHPVAV
jgi:hypothetical protein